VQNSTAEIYSAFVVDSEIDDCFLLDHETRHFPKKNVFPLVFFFSSTSAFGYHNKKSKV
jgi:hypothetical protein